MMLPYVTTAVFVMLLAIGLLSLLLAVVVIAATLVILVFLAAANGSPSAAYRAISQYLSLLWAYYRIRGRWFQFVPPVVLWPALMIVLWQTAPVVHTERREFLHEYSSFLQTAAQVLAALLIALAIEARAPKSIEDTIAVRPATTLTVVLLAVAELACLAVLSPFLPTSLNRLTLYLVIASGVAAILAVLLLSWRILSEEDDVI
jgi:hypothetical protein